jgi:excisionase family DNA binding protein
MNTQEFYTAKEISDKLKLNVMTIYRYINAGKLKAYKIGKEFRVEKEGFEEFLRQMVIK